MGLRQMTAENQTPSINDNNFLLSQQNSLRSKLVSELDEPVRKLVSIIEKKFQERQVMFTAIDAKLSDYHKEREDLQRKLRQAQFMQSSLMDNIKYV